MEKVVRKVPMVKVTALCTKGAVTKAVDMTIIGKPNKKKVEDKAKRMGIDKVAGYTASAPEYVRMECPLEKFIEACKESGEQKEE